MIADSVKTYITTVNLETLEHLKVKYDELCDVSDPYENPRDHESVWAIKQLIDSTLGDKKKKMGNNADV